MEKPIKDQSKFLTALSEMLGVLAEDMILCESQLKEPELAWRRMYVRSTFAAIEALSFFLKQHTFNGEIFTTLDSLKTSKPVIRTRKLSLLMDETYILDDNGKPRTVKAKLRTVPNLLFALSAFRESVGSKHILVKDAGFHALKKGVRIRDSLTHPKNPESLNVTDEQIGIVKAAFAWVRRELTQIIKDSPGVTITTMEMPIKDI